MKPRKRATQTTKTCMRDDLADDLADVLLECSSRVKSCSVGDARLRSPSGKPASKRTALSSSRVTRFGGGSTKGRSSCQADCSEACFR